MIIIFLTILISKIVQLQIYCDKCYHFLKLINDLLYIQYKKQGDQAPMSTPKKDDLVENLYEIPCCTICLVQLNQELATLACGHCFHLTCITTHFEYKGTCPNCQKRACLKQARMIHFNLVLNSKASAQLRSLLSSLSLSEREPMQKILKQLKIQSEQAERLRNQNHHLELQLKTKIKPLQNMKEELNRKINQIQILRKSHSLLQRQMMDLRADLIQREQSEAYLQVKLQKLQNQLRDYQLFKKYKKAMNENSVQLLRLKQEMQFNNTPPAQMVKQFFQLCQMSKLQEGKTRQRLRDLQLKVEFNEEQNRKQKEHNQKLQREISRLNEKLQAEKRRIQQVQFKYKKVLQKQMSVEEKEDSNFLSNTTRKIVKVQTQLKINSFLNTNNIQQSLQNSVRKPSFAGSSKFGGLAFKKKEDMTKILNIK